MAKTRKSEITIRSSAAEYLTFIAASGEDGVEAVYADENVWLSQKMMAELYSVETSVDDERPKSGSVLTSPYFELQLERISTRSRIEMVQTEGSREVAA